MNNRPSSTTLHSTNVMNWRRYQNILRNTLLTSVTLHLASINVLMVDKVLPSKTVNQTVPIYFEVYTLPTDALLQHQETRMYHRYPMNS